jgi:hypothetical protein
MTSNSNNIILFPVERIVRLPDEYTKPRREGLSAKQLLNYIKKTKAPKTSENLLHKEHLDNLLERVCLHTAAGYATQEFMDDQQLYFETTVPLEEGEDLQIYFLAALKPKTQEGI